MRIPPSRQPIMTLAPTLPNPRHIRCIFLAEVNQRRRAEYRAHRIFSL